MTDSQPVNSMVCPHDLHSYDYSLQPELCKHMFLELTNDFVYNE